MSCCELHEKQQLEQCVAGACFLSTLSRTAQTHRANAPGDRALHPGAPGIALSECPGLSRTRLCFKARYRASGRMLRVRRAGEREGGQSNRAGQTWHSVVEHMIVTAWLFL